MEHTHTILAHFPSFSELERVVLKLQEKGFDMQKLSIIGKDYQTTEDVCGFFNLEKKQPKLVPMQVDIGIVSSEVFLAF
ncbi:hypothetical protein [Neosynechococcus sphagnicola]|uniref:hypothetical protein n=1 Tax=Neosynechococcus sphagnicola TaxID=1501145 RepID=UPI0019552BBF|nr:hypothetical protein [Neosynechococcus sphagnicola]